MTALMSLMPEVTALKVMNSMPLARAMRNARVVLPEPGGPQKIRDGNCPFWCRSAMAPEAPDSFPPEGEASLKADRLAMTWRSGLSGDMISSWPINSSNFKGRIRSASGVATESRLFRGGVLPVLLSAVSPSFWLTVNNSLSLLCSIMPYNTFMDYLMSTKRSVNPSTDWSAGQLIGLNRPEKLISFLDAGRDDS